MLSALNFGFVGSKAYPGGSQQWYAAFPQAFPYSLARGTPNDHCYNPWADVIYKASDAYCFAFSDRIAPSPLMGTDPTNEYLRITRLPQNQIDAPLVANTKVTSDKINLTWPAESGVTYTVTTIPPVPTKQITIDSNADTPYQIAVQGSIAAHASTGQRSSRVLPLTVCTHGALQGITGAVSFQALFNWTGTTQWPSGYSASINGTQFPLSSSGVNSGNVSLSGGVGDNYYAITINDQSENRVYSAIMPVTFAGSAPNYQLASAPKLYGSDLLVAVQPAPQSYPVTTAGLVLGIPFDPIAQKSYGPVA